MIDFVEIRDENRAIIGVLDTAKSIIWNIAYYDIGDFEIYAPLTAENAALLQVGHYVTRNDERNIGLIDRVNITYNAQDGRMITAAGGFAKSILSQRLIYSKSGNSITPVVSRGNVETAVRTLVTNNIISAADTARNISFIELGALAGLSAIIVDDNGKAADKQTSFGNLQEYTDGILQEYDAGAYVGIDRDTQKLQYIVYAGADRSIDNTDGNTPIIFSQDYDNLLATDYKYDRTALKNTALIGGEGEGTARYIELLSGGSGINRREIFVDASSQSRTYTEGETEKQYTDAVYSQMLLSNAKQELAALAIVETLDSELDITNSALRLGADFYAGDIITVQDNELGKYINARIITVTEVQDDNGYSINIAFGG